MPKTIGEGILEGVMVVGAGIMGGTVVGEIAVSAIESFQHGSVGAGLGEGAGALILTLFFASLARSLYTSRRDLYNMRHPKLQ